MTEPTPKHPRHCWETGPAGDWTCMLPAGHDGDHEFTPDYQIELALQLAAYAHLPERS